MTEEPKQLPLVEAALDLSTRVLRQAADIRDAFPTVAGQIELSAVELFRFANRAAAGLKTEAQRSAISEAVLRSLDCSAGLELAANLGSNGSAEGLRELAAMCRAFSASHAAQAASDGKHEQASNSEQEDRIAQRMEAARRHREMMADLRKLASGESGMQSPL